MIVYLDMDGVLTNFDKRYRELFGIPPEDVSRKEEHFWANWKSFVLGNNFTTLELLPDAKELLDYTKELQESGITIEILSSSGGQQFHDVVKAQKLIWLDKHGITYKANIVPGGHLKAKYALSPWYILVDDTPRVIEGFTNAGGTGILHTSAKETIDQLKKLHYEWRHPADSII